MKLMTIIRRAIPSDAEGIANVQLKSWRWAYRGILPDEWLAAQTIEERIGRWKETLGQKQSKDSAIWVACDSQSNVVGYIMAAPARYDDRAGMDGEIRTFYVLPEVARSGVGQLLWREAVAFLKAHFKKGFYVMVLPQNNIGRSYYEKVGGTELHGDFTVDFGGNLLVDSCYIWKF